MADKAAFGIVGASLAGAKAAETLRKEGFDGRVVLLGEESEGDRVAGGGEPDRLLLALDEDLAARAFVLGQHHAAVTVDRGVADRLRGGLLGLLLAGGEGEGGDQCKRESARETEHFAREIATKYLKSLRFIFRGKHW